MATLFERLIGSGDAAGNPDPQNSKMAIHAFDGCMNYLGSTIVGYGPVTGVQISGWFNLTTDQQTQMIYLKDLIAAAAAAGVRSGFQRANKDFLYNGEYKTNARWTDENAYWATLQDIISDAGGTPPVKPW